MTDRAQGNQFDAEQWAFGYQEGTGSWTIDIPVPNLPLRASLNTLTARAMDSFVDASRDFLGATAVRFESVRVDPEGRIAEANEGNTILDETDRRLSERLMLQLAPEQQTVLTTIFIKCNSAITLPSKQGGGESPVTLLDAGEFYLGYLLDLDKAEIPFVTNCRLNFETFTDVWLKNTRVPGTMQLRNNDIAALRNEPSLERFLREWEKIVEQPITEWESRLYREQIFRYGFRNS
jgi:hypothetical protein